MPDPSVKPAIFISYSHRDLRWLQFVQSHLQVGVQNDHFDTWDDRRIGGGVDWAKEIDNALRTCAVFILLVSRHSLVSSFILDHELKSALEANWRRGVRIYPIIVDACDIQAVSWLTKMNIRPRDAKPLARYSRSKRDEVMASIAAEVRTILGELVNAPPVDGGTVEPKPKRGNRKVNFREPKHLLGTIDNVNSETDRLDAERSAAITWNPMIIGEAFAGTLQLLQVSSRIKESIRAVATHPEYPSWMSVSGSIVRNPVWEDISEDKVHRMTELYHPAGRNPPQIMHLDMLLLRHNDERGHGQLHTYYSPDWDTYLLTFRQRRSEEKQNQRKHLNAAKIARHWSITSESINVRPLRDKYAISIKQHPKYQDLICYVFEFCSVTLSDLSTSTVDLDLGDLLEDLRPRNKWLDLSQLRKDEASWSVNGDVIRAIHELFTYDLGSLPVFSPHRP